MFIVHVRGLKGNKVINRMKSNSENIQMQEDPCGKFFHLRRGAESFWEAESRLAGREFHKFYENSTFFNVFTKGRNRPPS